MKKSHESSEDYLETILILREQNGNVRSIDIVNKLNYSKPSISIAMKKLKSEGMVEMDLNGYITLTAKGEEVREEDLFQAQAFGEMPDRDRRGSRDSRGRSLPDRARDRRRHL